MNMLRLCLLPLRVAVTVVASLVTIGLGYALLSVLGRPIEDAHSEMVVDIEDDDAADA